MFKALKILKIPIISITSNKKSSISLKSKINLCSYVIKEACPFNISPTCSTTSLLVMGDALAITLLESKKFTRKKISLLHPGGEIGKKFISIKDIMLTFDKIPSFYKDSLLRKVFIKIFNKKFSIAVIYNNSMKIKGIFTDNELFKVINTNINLNNSIISDVLKLKNFYVYSSFSISKTLSIMKKYKTNGLLVKHNNKYIGVIHLNNIINFNKKNKGKF